VEWDHAVTEQWVDARYCTAYLHKTGADGQETCAPSSRSRRLGELDKILLNNRREKYELQFKSSSQINQVQDAFSILPLHMEAFRHPRMGIDSTLFRPRESQHPSNLLRDGTSHPLVLKHVLLHITMRKTTENLT
jgi:hypothetical protein